MGCDVLVVDESYEKVQEISDKVSYAVKADVSEPDALQALGGRNLDGVVVAISESLEASIMATMLCKEMGIPLVVAKAKDKLQGAILQRVGADRIVYPEIEMGSRVAKSLVSKEFAKLCNAVHKKSDFFSELTCHIVKRHIRIFYCVVEHSCHDRLFVHLKIRQNNTDPERVDNIRLS